MKNYLSILIVSLLFTPNAHAEDLRGWSTADLCDVVSGSAGVSISSDYIKKLKSQTRWTSKEYKAIQRGKLFSGMSESALLCSMPNLELEYKDMFGGMYVMVTRNGEYRIATDKEDKVYMAPWSRLGM